MWASPLLPTQVKDLERVTWRAAPGCCIVYRTQDGIYSCPQKLSKWLSGASWGNKVRQRHTCRGLLGEELMLSPQVKYKGVKSNNPEKIPS